MKKIILTILISLITMCLNAQKWETKYFIDDFNNKTKQYEFLITESNDYFFKFIDTGKILIIYINENKINKVNLGKQNGNVSILKNGETEYKNIEVFFMDEMIFFNEIVYNEIISYIKEKGIYLIKFKPVENEFIIELNIE